MNPWSNQTRLTVGKRNPSKKKKGIESLALCAKWRCGDNKTDGNTNRPVFTHNKHNGVNNNIGNAQVPSHSSHVGAGASVKEALNEFDPKIVFTDETIANEPERLNCMDLLKTEDLDAFCGIENETKMLQHSIAHNLKLEDIKQFYENDVYGDHIDDMNKLPTM